MSTSNLFRVVVCVVCAVVIAIVVDIFVVSATNIVNKYRLGEKIDNIIATNNTTSDVTETDVPVINEKIENTIFSEEQVPAWLGSPVSAKYTRVQQKPGEKFRDMLVFTFEHGVIMAPNGVIDMNLVYAFDEDTANQHGVDHCLKNASYSGVWTGSKWAPAHLVEGCAGRWIYAGKNAAWDHTVSYQSIRSYSSNTVDYIFAANKVNVIPRQSYNIDGNKITIKYCKGNKSDIMNTELVFTVL